MSRRRRRSRAPGLVALLIIAVLIGAAGLAWRYHRGWLSLPYLSPSDLPSSSATASRPPAQSGQHTSTVTATLYFRRVRNGAERLVAVRRELPGPAPARTALEALISGEIPAGCERPLPKGTKLRGVSIRQGTATADFSQELIGNFQGGSENEGVVVYAIVNTLNSLPTVERTQITVEGEKLDTLGGHVEISEPLATDEELVVAR